MKKFLIAFSVFGILGSATAFGQGAAPDASDMPPDAAYLAMVDQAMLSPGTINWAEIRKLYAKSSFYADFKSTSVSQAYYAAGKSAAAAPMMAHNFKDLQRQQYGNFNSHVYSIKVGTELPSEEINVADEKKVLEAIADSIVENADGSSAAKAYVVVSPDEEALVVETLLQQKISATTPTAAGGHKYDIITYNDSATKKPVKLFFNTDLVPPKPLK